LLPNKKEPQVSLSFFKFASVPSQSKKQKRAIRSFLTIFQVSYRTIPVQKAKRNQVTMLFQETRNEQPCKPLEYFVKEQEKIMESSESSETSDEDFEEQFEAQLEDFHRLLQEIYEPWSIEHAETALEKLYIALSVQDSKLNLSSKDGNNKNMFKSILVHDGAMDVLLAALRRKYPSPSFSRRACACLAYFIRDSPERATLLVERGGFETVMDVMDSFLKNEVIQLYCLDLLGLLACNASYNYVVWATLVQDLVYVMADLHFTSEAIYQKACRALLSSFSKKQQVGDLMGRQLSQLSREMVRWPQESGNRGMREEDIRRLEVCHDMLQVMLANEK
jgi:hypothetical protein